jgi:hypothetical protein
VLLPCCWNLTQTSGLALLQLLFYAFCSGKIISGSWRVNAAPCSTIPVQPSAPPSGSHCWPVLLPAVGPWPPAGPAVTPAAVPCAAGTPGQQCWQSHLPHWQQPCSTNTQQHHTSWTHSSGHVATQEVLSLHPHQGLECGSITVQIAACLFTQTCMHVLRWPQGTA